jgi:hypothetical protein
MPSLPFASALSVLPLLALLSACAAPAPGGKLAAADEPQTDVVCFYEAATGTNRKVRRCMSKEEYNKGVESAQRMAGELKIPPPPPQ